MIAISTRGALVALCLTAASGPAAAQTVLSFDLHYLARETYTDPVLGDVDNDHFRLSFGIGRRSGDRVIFGALGLGVHNEYWDDFSDHAELQAGAYWLEDWGRHGGLIRGLYSEDFGDALTVGYGLEVWRPNVTYRGLLEAGHHDGPTEPGSHTDVFALAEASWYPADWVALRGGVMMQSNTPFALIGGELSPFARVPVSVYFDWSVALDDGYRGFSEDYNDLAMGFRLTLGGGSLQERDRIRPTRLFYRPLDAF